MQNKKIKRNKITVIIATLLIITLAIGCSTTTKRDQALIEALEMQNATIDQVLNQNKSGKKDTQKKLTAQKKVFKAIYESNQVVIKKLKPKQKKECNCGKD